MSSTQLMRLEVTVLPVADDDRAKAFYERLGWRVDADFPLDGGSPASIRHGADVSRVWHGRGLGTDGHEPGPDPDRSSYRTFASFRDPDGNRWLLQEIKERLPGRE